MRRLGLIGSLLPFCLPLAVAPPASPAVAPLASPTLAHAAGAAGLHVIPFPRTPGVSPQTQIIFSSLAPEDLRSVTVRGSISGRHRGRLMVLPDRAGTAFSPVRPFTGGEHVEVSAQLRSSAATAAAGVPAGRRLRYWFTIALSPRESAPLTRDTPRRPASTQAGPVDGRYFHSVPHLHPPTVSATPDPDTASGDIFVTPRQSFQRQVNIQTGPMILDSRGQLVWFRNTGGEQAGDLKVQTYRGRPVLTWWQGSEQNLRAGKEMIVNDSYRTLATLQAGNGYTTDPHDFQITPRGTALIGADNVVKADLSAVGGPMKGEVLDNIIQEVDIRTGRVVWEWHSYGHVPLSASYIKVTPPRAFDYFHLNSIQQLPDGNIVVSARDTWGVYEIDRSTGNVLWTLGGKDSNFSFPPGARFSWQHDARLNGDKLSLFDDASDGPTQQESQSSGKVLQLDTHTMRATLLHRYTHKPALSTYSQGSTQRLPNGNVFVGWGADPEFSEYTRAGRQIFDASFAPGVSTYRAYRFPWVGRPATPPALALSAGHGHHVNLYASWNGATGVAVWRVLGGSSPRALRYLTRASRTGFETTIRLRTRLPYLAVQALDDQHNVLATSGPERNPQ